MSARCRGRCQRGLSVEVFVTSFGGLLAEMGVRESANTPPSVSNVNSRAGGAVGEVEKSVAQMRIKTLEVEKPPRRGSKGLLSINFTDLS